MGRAWRKGLVDRSEMKVKRTTISKQMVRRVFFQPDDLERRILAHRSKRMFDFICAFAGVVFFAPSMALIAFMIKISSSPGRVLYKGIRVGRGGKTFEMLKFRTMVTDAERQGGSATAGDDPRVTRVGRFLRKYKLDELPQLINVLKGEMSLVGPRSDVPKYADMYSKEERIILGLSPGITDWATIWNTHQGDILEASPNAEESYEKLIRPTKTALQLRYAYRHSFTIDLRILCFTAFKLCRPDWFPKELQRYGKPKRYRALELEPLLETLQREMSTQC